MDRTEIVALIEESKALIEQSEQALAATRKIADKDMQKQLKLNIKMLRKIIAKANPDKMGIAELTDLRHAVTMFKSSCAGICHMAENAENWT